MNPSESSRKRAALYIRVSTAEQGEKYGPDYQRKEMMRFVEYWGYTVQPQHVYTDISFSGASPVEERQALPALFEAASRREFDLVLVWKLDRFFRRTLYLLQAIERLQKLGVGFISTTQTEVNTTTTTGKFMIGLLGIIAEMERDNIMERTAAGRQAAASAGKWVGGRCPPYGYDIDPDTGVMKVNEAETKVVRKIFDWFANDRLTLYQIQQHLNALRIPTKADSKLAEIRTARRFRKEYRKRNPACFWGGTTILAILKQEAYTGQYHYGKRSRKKDEETGVVKFVVNPRERWVPISCIQIISKDLWQKAQDRLEENRALSHRSSRHEYLLSGKIVCGDCGSVYIGYTQPKWRKAKGERVLLGEYPNYRCRRGKKTASAVPCRNRQVSGTLLETEVWSQVEALLADPEDFISTVQEAETSSLDTAGLEAKVREITDAVLDLDRQYLKACELFEKGLMYREEGEIEKRASEINAEKERRIADRDAICGLLLTEAQKKDRILAAKDLASCYADTRQNADFKTKKELVHRLVKQITVFPDRVRIEFTVERPRPSGESRDSGTDSPAGCRKAGEQVMHLGTSRYHVMFPSYYLLVKEVGLTAVHCPRTRRVA